LSTPTDFLASRGYYLLLEVCKPDRDSNGGTDYWHHHLLNKTYWYELISEKNQLNPGRMGSTEQIQCEAAAGDTNTIHENLPRQGHSHSPRHQHMY
jgi:hypothetical protein